MFAIALFPEVTVACKVCLKRVHTTCSLRLLNDCLDAQASSVDAYECLLCNSIKGCSSPSNFPRQNERCLDANLMPDEPNCYEMFFNNCHYCTMILKRLTSIAQNQRVTACC